MTAPPDGRTLVAGAAWIGLYRWTAQLVSWAAMLLVLRLLDPADFGIASLALAVAAIAAILSEFGLGTAVVVLPKLDERTARQLHGSACLLGVVVGALFVLVAPALATFYDQPELAPVGRVLGLVFVAEGVRLVPLALLSRRLAYRTTAFVDFLRAVATSATVLALAWKGAGYWALILGNLAGAALSALYLVAWHGLRPAWPRVAELRGPIQYSFHLFVSRGAWALYRTSDVLIGGRLVASQVLGIYTMATTLASLPGEKLGNVLTAATAPFFAAIQADRAALRRYFLKVTEALALVLYPVMFGFMAVADLAVPLVLGQKWAPAVPVVRILFGYAALHGVTTLVAQVLNVTGHTRATMVAGLRALAILPPAFLVGGLLGGIHGIALAWLAGYPLVLAYPVRVLLKELGLSFRDYLGTVRRAVEGVVVMLLVVLLVRRVVAPPLGDWAELGIATLAGALGYLGLLWLRHRSLLLAVPRLFRGARPPSPGPTPAPGGAPLS